MLWNYFINSQTYILYSSSMLLITTDQWYSTDLRYRCRSRKWDHRWRRRDKQRRRKGWRDPHIASLQTFQYLQLSSYGDKETLSIETSYCFLVFGFRECSLFLYCFFFFFFFGKILFVSLAGLDKHTASVILSYSAFTLLLVEVFIQAQKCWMRIAQELEIRFYLLFVFNWPFFFFFSFAGLSKLVWSMKIVESVLIAQQFNLSIYYYLC